MVKVAEVIFIHLLCFKNPVSLHVFQWQTSGISVLQLFVGFPMITVHFSALFPPLMAFAYHSIMPSTKVFVHELGIFAPLTISSTSETLSASEVSWEDPGASVLASFAVTVFDVFFCVYSCASWQLILGL